MAEDVGSVGQSGDAMFNQGAFTISGGGADIWDNADGFQFAYRTMHGDGSVVAHVTSLSDGDGWIKAGVMIRQKPAPDSQHAFACVTRDQGVSFQRRRAAGGASDHTPGPAAHAPYWVKLARQGNLFTASASADGKDWAKVGEESIEMSPDVLVGLAVTAHNNSAVATANFDAVSTPSAGRN